MTRICKHGYVAGKVQGVWFRGFTQDQALTMGLTGWARNLPDGRVEILLCGDATAVEAVIATLHEGPPMAEVREISFEETVAQAPKGFEIS